MQGACVADYAYGGTRTQELHKFIHDPECFVMLLVSSRLDLIVFIYRDCQIQEVNLTTCFLYQSMVGSVGLDLSFVTHIFFLGELHFTHLWLLG